ncbi:MAG TPA: hypothetical protein VGO93_23690 [Candidatus Xenobia bacterium]|jgi:hypothetical protein
MTRAERIQAYLERLQAQVRENEALLDSCSDILPAGMVREGEAEIGAQKQALAALPGILANFEEGED